MQPEQNQHPIESYPSGYGSQGYSPDAKQKKLVIAAMIGGVILVVLLFLMLFTGGGPANIDRLLIREQNLLTIAQTAQTYNTGFEAERVISNTIVLVKGDLSALNSYRDENFRRRIDQELSDELTIDASELESKLSTAKQLDRLNTEIKNLYETEINAILIELAAIKTNNSDLEETLQSIEQNLNGIKAEIELLDGSQSTDG